jgi:hypothetical protein
MAKPLENNLIKTPHKSQHWNNEQILEFVKCADPVTGPLHFMQNYFYIQHPVKGKLLYEPFSYQVGLIDTYHNYRFSINLLSRQMGKCLGANTIINIKNNRTGKEYEIPIGVYFEFMRAKEAGEPLPEISNFEINNM